MGPGPDRALPESDLTLAGALARTLLLMRDEVDANNEELLAALQNTKIALVSDCENLSTVAGQTAFVTAALLLARSAHTVYLVAREIDFLCPQPPLTADLPLLDGLLEIGNDLLPGVSFVLGSPRTEVDLAILFGSSSWSGSASRTISVSGEDWSAIVRSRIGQTWRCRLPMGAFIAAALVASEAFKVSLQKLSHRALSPRRLIDLTAPITSHNFSLAPSGVETSLKLGAFDVVSAGAITHSLLYVLARVERLTGIVRTIDDDVAELSNLNRYMLLRRSRLGSTKSNHLETIRLGEIRVHAVCSRLDPENVKSIRPWANSVLVGVDDIPTRWLVQNEQPTWLGIGATTHWDAMSSFHERDLACAKCLHPRSTAINGHIPTVAFVSFWAGLLLGTCFLRRFSNAPITPSEQQVYLTPFRPEGVWRSGIKKVNGCTICAEN